MLHDWDDTHATRILAALGRSATRDTRLWILEMLLPTDASPHRAKMSDVLMLLMFDGARERTLGQYRDLLEDTRPATSSDDCASNPQPNASSISNDLPSQGSGPARPATYELAAGPSSP